MTFWLLLCGHALCDYPLQGEFLARGKNHKAPIAGIPFYHCMIAHALIHGGMVTLITRSLLLGMLETVAHAVIDWLKCDGRTNLDIDQTLHIVCKICWVALLAHGVK